MSASQPLDLTFRAWSDDQAQRFIAVIPEDLLVSVSSKKWSESSKDVIVTISYNGSLKELQELLSKVDNASVMRKTLAPSADFTFRGK